MLATKLTIHTISHSLSTIVNEFLTFILRTGSSQLNFGNEYSDISQIVQTECPIFCIIEVLYSDKRNFKWMQLLLPNIWSDKYRNILKNQEFLYDNFWRAKIHAKQHKDDETLKCLGVFCPWYKQNI